MKLFATLFWLLAILNNAYILYRIRKGHEYDFKRCAVLGCRNEIILSILVILLLNQ